MTRVALAAALLAVALCTPAHARNLTPVAPHDLPAGAAAASVRDWIVGVRPGSDVTRIARRHGAHRRAGALVVSSGSARALVRDLGQRVVWSEPDRLRRPRQAPAGGDVATPWRDRVVVDGLTPPPVGPRSPLVALVDSPIESAHPEFAPGNVVGADPVAAIDLHGTATAAVAAAAEDGSGIRGIWPGARALNVPLPRQPFSCSDSARGIRRAIEADAAVINMSYGSPDFCFLEYLQLQLATRLGITLVAAAGNEFAEGNPLEFPGAMPHVLTVAAVGPGDEPSYFSNANAAIDLAAPGEGVTSAVPAEFDEDSDVDGYMALDGTSFAAPMVAGTAAWVRAARPELSADQVAQVVRLGARDLGSRGWDADTGFGLLDVAGALSRAAPPRDPSEPNDEIVWVDGEAFGTPNAYVSRKGRTGRVRALLDRFEDPADVYRVSFPGGSRLRITVKPAFGDPDLKLFSRGADNLSDDARLVSASTREGSRRETVVVRNRARRARKAFVAVYVDPSVRSLDAGYVLKVRRAGR